MPPELDVLGHACVVIDAPPSDFDTDSFRAALARALGVFQGYVQAVSISSGCRYHVSSSYPYGYSRMPAYGVFQNFSEFARSEGLQGLSLQPEGIVDGLAPSYLLTPGYEEGSGESLDSDESLSHTTVVSATVLRAQDNDPSFDVCVRLAETDGVRLTQRCIDANFAPTMVVEHRMGWPAPHQWARQYPQAAAMRRPGVRGKVRHPAH